MKDTRTVSSSIPEELSGERADTALAELMGPEWSRSRIKRALLSLSLDGKAAKLSDRVQANARLEVSLSDEPPLKQAHAEEIPLEIVYEDDDIIVINKPCGMATHPSAGITEGTVVNALLFHCRNLASGPESPLRPGIVHRLDKDTSGLLVCVKSEYARVSLSRAFHDRQVHKIYSAIVRGRMTPRQGMIDAAIGRDPLRRTRQAVVEGGRAAQTGYKVIEEFENYSHLEMTLFTGRTHQIRVHLSHIERPIIGDPVYSRSDALSDTLCLAAVRLSFAHPRDGRELEFRAPLPRHMQSVLNTLRAAANASEPKRIRT